MKPEAIKALTDACIAAKNEGWKLTSGAGFRTLVFSERCCCAFGAVLLYQGIEFSEGYMVGATEALNAASSIGFYEEEAWDIIRSFDSPGEYKSMSNISDANRLGIHLRETYGT